MRDGKHMRYPGDDHDRRWRERVFPGNYRNPEPRRKYHLAVIGAGPAGLVASIAAAGLGARVALVERKAITPLAVQQPQSRRPVCSQTR